MAGWPHRRVASEHRLGHVGSVRAVSGGVRPPCSPTPSRSPIRSMWSRLANQKLDECRRRVQNETMGHRGRKDDPLYRARRLLTRADERLDSNGRVAICPGAAHRSTGLCGSGSTAEPPISVQPAPAMERRTGVSACLLWRCLRCRAVCRVRASHRSMPSSGPRSSSRSRPLDSWMPRMRSRSVTGWSASNHWVRSISPSLTASRGARRAASVRVDTAVARSAVGTGRPWAHVVQMSTASRSGSIRSSCSRWNCSRP